MSRAFFPPLFNSLFKSNEGGKETQNIIPVNNQFIYFNSFTTVVINVKKEKYRRSYCACPGDPDKAGESERRS